MVLKGKIVSGAYFDSVSLMIAANRIREQQGILDASLVMGSRENRAILETAGFCLPQFEDAKDTDLLIVIQGEEEDVVNAALEGAETFLLETRKGAESQATFQPKSLEGALQRLPDANLALISVPGKYAATEAFKALRRGLHVMIFSDNVPLEEEVALKKFAKSKGLMIMGPDCGTAILHGAPLAFANRVKRGTIGIVGASGTGIQEISCLISNHGGGISHAIGIGGRDLQKKVRGLMCLSALEALSTDKGTEIILIVSKPPHPSVMEKIGKSAGKLQKPVVGVFLGADPAEVQAFGMMPASTLEEGAIVALRLSRDQKEKVDEKSDDGKLVKLAEKEASRLTPNQRYIRALFSGGTFCYEAQLVLKDVLDEIYSNTPAGSSNELEDPLCSASHSFLDLGDDRFTRGKIHPMIDAAARGKRIVQEARDPETALILLDVVLGFGANPDPVSALAPALREASRIAQHSGRHLPILCSVVGTNQDPQNREEVVQALQKAGALVLRSNAEASLFAGMIIERLDRQG